ncbi:MAG: acyltransferase domain-containing protein [Geodermatophilaceae bacterium]|nr:acyltransferase domain-containing protein [Geodermatophilaceae bacterium]
MLVLLAPGQGSQAPGMLTPWLQLPAAGAVISWMSALTGLDLHHLGTEADAEQIRDTAVTQPLIVALGLLAARELDLDGAGVTAGHSVGELTAAAAAGVLHPDTAVALAAVRGREMAAACGRADTGMSAVLGGDPEDVVRRVTECGLTAANRNGAGQIVAAGLKDRLEQLRADPPAKARVVPLPVAGAFHTEYMAPAEEALAALAGGITTNDPDRLLLSNADGTAVQSGAEMLERLVRQVTAPVRFDSCLATMRHLGVTAALELPPAGTLAGLVKRELKGVDIVALKTPEDLPAARDLLARHAGAQQAEHTPDWRVIVAPVRGTMQHAGVSAGADVAAGTPLGTVVSKREEVHVSATYDGVLAEWLVEDGDLVDAGDPLARLYPAGSR